MSLYRWLPELLTLHGLVTVAAILVYVISSHLSGQRRQPAAAIAWMLFILLLPYLALPAFLMFGSRKQLRPQSAPGPALVRMHPAASWAVETSLALGQPAPVGYLGLQIHADGEQARAALFEIIGSAHERIDICTFILGRDPLGRAVVDLLCQKARSGVRVRLLIDGLGSLMSRPPSLRRLVAAGAGVARFASPLGSTLKGRTNLRDHRKLVIVDSGGPQARLWCGGRNLAAEYFGGLKGAAPWRDLTIDLSGAIVDQAAMMFERDWAFATGAPTEPAPSRPQAATDPHGAQLIASGPDQADDTLQSLLVSAAYRARRRIVLATPYFVPDTALITALCLAARRGVSVELLLPARSNHRLSDFARSRALRSLAAAGGQVRTLPGMLHAKLVVVDDVLALVGSANLDSRSLFLNYELMLAFHAPGDVRRFTAWFDSECRAASSWTPEPPGLVRDVAEGMLLWLGFQL